MWSAVATQISPLFGQHKEKSFFWTSDLNFDVSIVFVLYAQQLSTGPSFVKIGAFLKMSTGDQPVASAVIATIDNGAEMCIGKSQ